MQKIIEVVRRLLREQIKEKNITKKNIDLSTRI